MRRDRPRIVIVAHVCPYPPVHGNRSRLVGLLEWFRANGIAVTFILQPLDVEAGDGLSRLRDVVDRLEVVKANGLRQSAVAWARRRCVGLAQGIVPEGLRRFGGRMLRRDNGGGARVREEGGAGDLRGEGHIDRWCWPATSRAVERAVRREQPIAVLAEYALLSRCLEGVPPSVLKIIDTVEVFFRNNERFETAGLTAPVICSPESEMVALGRADLLIAIQKNDAQALKERFPGIRVITVPHAYRRLQRRPGGPERGSVLYVASSNPFNVHGLREFIAHAWPSIVAQVPGATLRVAGSVPAENHAGTTHIVHLGRLSDADLAREYEAAHVVINPQVAGTGLKIKCVEALSVGCPLVMNRAGADGIEEGEGWAFLIASDWREFSDHVVSILTDDRLRLELESGARALADKLFSAAVTFSELAEALTMVRSTV